MEQPPSQPPTTVRVQLPARPVWAELLIMGLSLATIAALLVMMMPQAERQMLLTAAREQQARLYRGLSARARQAGHAGMTDELAGRNPAPWYEMARALAWWRDRVRP